MEKTPNTNFQLSTTRIDKAVRTLRDTKLGGVLLEFGLMKEVHIELNSQMETAGFYEESLLGGATVHLNATLDDYGLAIALAHELCHVEQTLVAPAPCTFSDPLDTVKLTRIFEAAASTYSTGVAYELFQKTGDKGYLDSLAAWEDDDIKDAFLAAATDTRPVTEDLKPFIAGFKQWFRKRKRVSHYDRAAIQDFNNYQDNVILGLLFPKIDAPLDFDMLKDIGHLLTHANYLKEINDKTPVLKTKRFAGNVNATTLRQAKAPNLS